MQRKDESRCARCGGASIPILYGYPTAEMFERERRGEVAIGGCVVKPGRPTRKCSQCGARW
jgi:hypothetical protein